MLEFLINIITSPNFWALTAIVACFVAFGMICKNGDDDTPDDWMAA